MITEEKDLTSIYKGGESARWVAQEIQKRWGDAAEKAAHAAGRAHKDYLSPERVREIGRELTGVKTMIARWGQTQGQTYRIM